MKESPFETVGFKVFSQVLSPGQSVSELSAQHQDAEKPEKQK